MRVRRTKVEKEPVIALGVIVAIVVIVAVGSWLRLPFASYVMTFFYKYF